jgi:hypothetical protein
MLIPPPRVDFCPNGQTEQLAESSFTNIHGTDLTNNVSKTATPATTAATVFTSL